MKVAVVIPAYNEAATIRDVAQRARAQGVTVIVVDDGSSDATREQLTGADVELLANSSNLGKAASLQRGMEHAHTLGCEAVITIDGDGQHSPEDIPRLLSAATHAPNSIIIAARLRNLENSPRARLFANRFADFWISWAAGVWIRDTQSGFRLYPLTILKQVHVAHTHARSFVFESEILIEAARAGFGFVIVPIAAIYRRGARPSHFRPVVDIARIVRMVAWKLASRGMYVQGLARMFVRAAPVLDS